MNGSNKYAFCGKGGGRFEGIFKGESRRGLKKPAYDNWVGNSIKQHPVKKGETERGGGAKGLRFKHQSAFRSKSVQKKHPECGGIGGSTGKKAWKGRNRERAE